MLGKGGYLDMPYCVVMDKTGCFLCVLTMAASEGGISHSGHSAMITVD